MIGMEQVSSFLVLDRIMLIHFMQHLTEAIQILKNQIQRFFYFSQTNKQMLRDGLACIMWTIYTINGGQNNNFNFVSNIC